MSSADSLTPEQSAVLQLVTARGLKYAEIAELLGATEAQVRERAHTALDNLQPAGSQLLPASRRGELSDLLLGQLNAAGERASAEYLAGSDQAREWAGAVRADLCVIAGKTLPPLPVPPRREPEPPRRTRADATRRPSRDSGDELVQEIERVNLRERSDRRRAPTPPREPRRSERQSRSSASNTESAPPRRSRAAAPTGDPDRAPAKPSRLGWILVGVGAVILIVVVLVLIFSGGDSDNSKKKVEQQKQAQVKPESQVTLRGGSYDRDAKGLAQVFRQQNQRAMAIVGQDLRPTSKSSFYAVWLANSRSDATRLGFTPAVTQNGRLEALARLPGNSTKYRQVWITRETTAQPKKPGPIALSGKFE